jgi:cytochrome P450
MPAVLVTRYDDLRAFLSDQERFPGGEVYRFQTEASIGRTFISMDGRDHDVYRQRATPAFRSRATARFVDAELTPLAHEIVDRFAAKGEADLVAELARVLPFWAISRKLGLPIGSEERQRRWALGLLSHPGDPEGAVAASAEVTAFLEPIVEGRRASPGDDVISQLLAGFTDEEVFAHIRLLYAVGATTTSDAMSNLLWALLTADGLVERAVAEPDLRPRIVHELLRWEPPVALLPRLSGGGGEIGGVEVGPATLVLAAIAGANRDPAVFTDPDRFDPDREEGEVLTFGFGPKFCPGSHLARRQLLVALEVVLERLPRLQLVEASPPAGAVLRSSPSVVARWRPM